MAKKRYEDFEEEPVSTKENKPVEKKTGTVTTLANHLKSNPITDFYLRVLVEKTFHGQVRTEEEWKQSIKELLTKKL